MKFIYLMLLGFKFLCILTACWMAGFWIYKYAKNEDITLIEYKTFKDSNSMELPSMSICFVDPFVNKNTSSGSNNTINTKIYMKYLLGDKDLYPNYSSINYEDLS